MVTTKNQEEGLTEGWKSKGEEEEQTGNGGRIKGPCRYYSHRQEGDTNANFSTVPTEVRAALARDYKQKWVLWYYAARYRDSIYFVCASSAKHLW